MGWNKRIIAGEETLKKRGSERGYSCETGYNCHNIPKEDYYPSQKESATYSDGTKVPLNCKPIVFQVNIIGKMSNSPFSPHKDSVANGLMIRNLKMGNARRGYYYINDGEDEGSISAVVPDGSFLRIT